ncbi:MULTISPECIES: DUF2304 domain-containing protein [Corynebacterium]|uniref:DUF2304 domain-containing protein n=2 Tax=Corynebacterium TaxID=1716 RepID=A0A0B6TQQ1_9CORY|nr:MULTISPECIES: DUF2304 domain-containing protein [Corynebacterium]AJK67895.1 hypothetical protein B840_01315 [Corynebacterium marinum DSM 44953]GGO11772.1 membrane protein [Corynebacterium marinum]SMG14735.1 hypothetical protein SAMN06295981_0687 [Corynebacterium pollutisoli]
MTIILFQILLLLATFMLVVYFLSRRRKARAKAGVKLGFVLFIVAAVWAVLRPDDLTVLANFVGVDRGTDLLLYVVVVAFLFTTLSTWIRFREQELRYARLARAVALQTVVLPAVSGADEDRAAR